MATKDEPVVLCERVELENCGHEVAIVTINRPDRLNCFNEEVCLGLSDIFARIADEIDARDSQKNPNQETSTLVAVILTGAGKSFCAGADLSNPPNPLSQSSDLLCYLRVNPVYQMDRVQIPIIGAVKGHCITGGFELALACDFLIGDSTTKFKDTHVKFGLAPCWGLSQKLQRLVGPNRAKYISLSATSVAATKALEWGLLNEVVPNGQALRRSIEIADEIGANQSVMVRRYKRAIKEGGAMSLGHGLQRERELGIAHYLEAFNDGSTFEGARDFISDGNRPRSKL